MNDSVVFATRPGERRLTFSSKAKPDEEELKFQALYDVRLLAVLYSKSVCLFCFFTMLVVLSYKV